MPFKNNEKDSFFPCYLLLCVSFVSFFFYTWGYYGNLIIDNFRDLWIAREITQGKVLYKDLDYLYGFLAPYLLAFLFKVFGFAMAPAYGLGFLTGATTTFTFFRLCLRFFSCRLSTLFCLIFMGLFVFGSQSAYGFSNHIFPYTYSATLFITGALLSLEYYLSLLSKPSPSRKFLWNFGLTLAFLARPDLSLSLWGVFFLLEIFRFLKEKQFSLGISLLLQPIGVLLLYLLFLLPRKALGGFYESLADYVLYVASGKCYFNADVMGLHGLATHLKTLLFSFIFYLGSILGIWLYFYFREQTRSSLSLFALLCFLFLGGIFLKFQPYLQWFSHLPLLSLFLSVYFFLCYFLQKNSPPDKKALTLLTLSSFSFALSLRILFKASPDNYGFYLLVPGFALHLFFMLRFLPEILNPYFPLKNTLRSFRNVIAGMLLLSALPYFYTTHKITQLRTVSIPTSLGTLSFEPITRTAEFLKTVQYLKYETPPDSKVVVFPMGILINLLSERTHPLRYHEFLPHGLERFGEENILKNLEEERVNYIVLIHLISAPYEYKYFGKDYALKLMQGIETRYERVQVFGAVPFSGDDFGIAVYRKKIEK